MIDYELVKMRKEFREYYNTELKEDYVSLEMVRKKFFEQFIKRFALFLIPIIAWCWYLKSDILFWDGDIFKLYFIYGAVMYAFCVQPFGEYKSETKVAVMDKILQFFGSAKYQKRIIREDMLKSSGLFPSFSSVERDDEFVIMRDGVRIVVSEQKVNKRIKNGEAAFFRGIFILLDFKKNITSHLVVKEKGIRIPASWSLRFLIITMLLAVLFFIFCMSVFMVIGNWIIGMIVFGGIGIIVSLLVMHMCCSGEVPFFRKKMKGVLLEDVVFARKWNVTADDQIEARYVLTPALMERMLNIKKCFYGKKLDFSFFNGKCLIAVSTNKDMFETTFLLTKALSYHKVNEVITQIYLVSKVADLIKNQSKEK
ncbi:MAG: DUF3137 domain-containing protein [Acetobacter sp.]|nr:DUF3137 domain-containing protein [Acetobacter sp.]